MTQTCLTKKKMRDWTRADGTLQPPDTEELLRRSSRAQQLLSLPSSSVETVPPLAALHGHLSDTAAFTSSAVNGFQHLGGSVSLIQPTIDAVLRTYSEFWIKSGRKSHTLLRTIGFSSSRIDAASSGTSAGYQVSLQPLFCVIGVSLMLLALDVAFGSTIQAYLFKKEAAEPKGPKASPTPAKPAEAAEAATSGEATSTSTSPSAAEAQAAEFAAFKRRRWGYLLFTMLLGFSSEFLLWMLAPFFPSEALGRGVSREVVGLVFACQPIALLLGAQLAPLLLRSVDPFLLLQRSLFLQAVVIAGFGLAGGVASPSSFASCAATNRLLLGFLSGVNEPAAQAVTLRLVPGHAVSYSLSLVLGSRFAAMVAGPVAGGMLYAFGGFPLPFLVTGSGFVGLGCLAFVIGGQTHVPPLSQAQTDVPTTQLLRYPAVLLVLSCTFLLWFALMFLEPLYEPALTGAPYRLDSQYVGLVLSAGSASMVLSLSLASIINLNELIGPHARHALGFLLLACSLPFLGPFPPLGLPPTLGTFVAAICCTYLGAGLIGPTQAGIMLHSLRRAGLSQQEVAIALASLNVMVSTLGSLCGPVVAGTLVPRYVPFRTVTTLLAGVVALGIVPNALLVAPGVRCAREGEGCCGRGDEEGQQEEMLPAAAAKDN